MTFSPAPSRLAFALLAFLLAVPHVHAQEGGRVVVAFDQTTPLLYEQPASEALRDALQIEWRRDEGPLPLYLYAAVVEGKDVTAHTSSEPMDLSGEGERKGVVSGARVHGAVDDLCGAGFPDLCRTPATRFVTVREPFIINGVLDEGYLLEAVEQARASARLPEAAAVVLMAHPADREEASGMASYPLVVLFGER